VGSKLKYGIILAGGILLAEVAGGLFAGRLRPYSANNSTSATLFFRWNVRNAGLTTSSVN